MINIITGHYGSGKTNVTVNLALNKADEFSSADNNQKDKKPPKPITVIDLDIVNYYFRTADFTELFQNSGVRLLSPKYANSNLDIPVIGFEIEGLGENDGELFLDVGGDDAGAVALGVYSEYIQKHPYQMYYVINKYRYMTSTPEQALELMYEIENVSKLKHTAIINNSNLGEETTLETVENALEYAEKLAELSGLPVAFNTVPKNLLEKGLFNFAKLGNRNFKPVDIYVLPIWNDK